MKAQLDTSSQRSTALLFSELGWKSVLAVSVFIAITVFHVVNLSIHSELSYPSKLLLMPALLVAALVMSVRFKLWRKNSLALGVLFAGVIASWFGDGAAFFFQSLPELPMMLASFGVAHLCYIFMIWRTPGLAEPRLPAVSGLYAIAYIALIIILWPNAGNLQIAVLLYGLLLVATAVMTARCGAYVAWGGASFLISDAVLSLRLFTPENMPDGTGAVVMFTYTVGQGLIVLGIVWRLAQKK